MMTFSEALTQLKAGKDLRIKTWPARHFVRVVFVAGLPTPMLHQVPSTSSGTLVKTPYTYPNAEVFGQDWTRA